VRLLRKRGQLERSARIAEGAQIQRRARNQSLSANFQRKPNWLLGKNDGYYDR
jgi:hypothetical protein